MRTLFDMLSPFLLTALGLWVAGCSSSVHHVVTPMESEVGDDTYHYHVMTVMRAQPSLFHAVESTSFMQQCRTKIDHPQTEAEFLLPYKDCVRDDTYRQNTMGSVASQFVTPVITSGMYAGAIAYGLHQVGRGLGKSGDTVTQQGGGAESSATSKSGSDNVSVKIDQSKRAIGYKNVVK